MKYNNKNSPCSLCNSSRIEEIIDFGKVGLAGAFIKKDKIRFEKKYRMRLCFCKTCFTLQIIDKIEPRILFKNYFYYSSAIDTLRKHFMKLAEEVRLILKNNENPNILEFGCNDGVLLKPLLSVKNVNLVGVDPASNIIKSIKNKILIS